MNRNSAIFIVLGILAGFVAGFVFANQLNGTEIANLKARAEQSTVSSNSNSANTTPTSADLSAEEIRSKVAEADQNPNNFAFQKGLGISLYAYGASKRDADIIAESLRLLTRADSLNANDFDVLVALGNAHFDTGFYKEDKGSFDTAREIYNKALVVKPGDADVMTDIGISYFVQNPPDVDKSARELEKVVTANPRQDRAMQFLAQVYLKQNKIADAEKTLAKIIDLNPSNPAITEIRSLITEAKARRN